MTDKSAWISGLVLLAILGGGIYLYFSFLKPSQTFMDEYRNAQSHIKRIDSLLGVSNRKIDSSLFELGRIKDSISVVQDGQKASNKTVNEAILRMQADLKKQYASLNNSKASLRAKDNRIDSLELELQKRKPILP